MTTRAIVLALLGFLGWAAPVPAAAPPGRATVVYDVSDLVHRPGGRTGYDSAEGVIRAMTHWADAGAWRGVTLDVVNTTRLEVRATPARQAEVRDLLTALRRLNDTSVVVEANLYALDGRVYDREVKPRLGKGWGPGGAFAFAAGEGVKRLLARKADLLCSDRVLIADGRARPVLSLRRARVYVKDLEGPDAEPVPGTVFHGVSLEARVKVSADRQYVRLRLVRRVADLLGVEKLGNVERPRLAEGVASAAFTIGDGVDMLLPVPRRAGPRGRVQVLLVRPLILIGVEEKERRKDEIK
jgi:hypothetical protein